VSDRAIAIAQVSISIIFLVGYFFLLGMFVLGKARVDPEYKDIVNSLLSVLTAGVGAILYFWFQRTRPSSNDPNLADTK
jgi:ABC-type tungstate transport system substrate-binding protein